jgi:hypothetical protein
MKNKPLLIAGILLIISIISPVVFIQDDSGEIVQLISSFVTGALSGIVAVLVLQRAKQKKRNKQGG